MQQIFLFGLFDVAQFCIKSVMAAVETDSFESGKRKELEYASVLFQSGQAAALQYAFFAQRKAMQVCVSMKIPCRCTFVY